MNDWGEGRENNQEKGIIVTDELDDETLANISPIEILYSKPSSYSSTLPPPSSSSSSSAPPSSSSGIFNIYKSNKNIDDGLTLNTKIALSDINNLFLDDSDQKTTTMDIQYISPLKSHDRSLNIIDDSQLYYENTADYRIETPDIISTNSKNSRYKTDSMNFSSSNSSLYGCRIDSNNEDSFISKVS